MWIDKFALTYTLLLDPAVTSPVSQTNYLGQTNSFSVIALGTAPFGYQWQATNKAAANAFTNLVNGGQISGAGSNVLTISGITANNALAYRVIVTNVLGSVTSAPATLTILAGSPPLRIMPLGDSITRGATDPNGAGTGAGFRDQIYTLNTTANVNFLFVGATPSQPSPQLTGAGQQYHNGYGSYTTGDLYSNLTASFQPSYGDANVGGYWMTSGTPGGAPVQEDVVILLSGANDIYWNGNNSLSVFTNSENNLLGWFKTNRPATKVIVATDIPRNDSYSNQVLLVNQWITNKVPAFGTNFSTVDMYHLFIDANGAWKTASSPDGIYLYDAYHPSHNGYVAMGNVWFNAIQGVVNPNAPNFLNATASDSQISLTWSNVPGALGYNVKMSLTNGGAYTLIASNLATTSFTNTNLINGTNYYYVVSTVLGSGESPNSYQVNATPKSSTPGAIPLANWSFENNSVTDGNFSITTPTGWSVSGPTAGVVAVVNPGASDPRGYGGSPAGLDGNNYCQIYSTGAGDNASVYQDTGFQFQAGATYTLTAAFGMENSAFPSGTLVLYNSSLVVLASTNITAANLTLGAFKDFSVTYNATGNEGNIFVGFNVTGAASATSFDFDNVRLTANYSAAPTITAGPASLTNVIGTVAAFNVTVAGALPLSYQWQAGPVNGPFTNLVSGGIVSGVKTNTLTLTAVTTNWALTYRVIVTNNYGAVTSTPATLTVLLVAPPQPLRIMPLGDSITRGSTDPNYEYDFTTSAGYRDSIYTMNTNANVNFLFVGQATKQASPQLTAAGQQHHNGYGSYTTADLFNNFNGNTQPSPGDPNMGGYWMTSGTPGGAPVQVDVVTLMTGANDIGQNPNNYLQYFTNNEMILLGWFKTNRPNTKVIVAMDTARSDSTANNNAVLVINQWISNTVPTLSSNFSTVDLYKLFIDTNGAIKTQSSPDGISFNDGVHPTHNAYLAMGRAWFYAIQGAVNPTAPNFLSAVGGINSQATLTWTNVPGALGYNVKQSLTSGGPYSLIASNVSTASFTNNGLANGTTYYYVVSAIFGAGEGPNSYQASATPGFIPVANHSFDDNYVAYSSVLIGAPAGWTFSGPGNGQTAAAVFPASNDTRFNTYPVSGLDGLMYAQIFVSGTAGYGSLYINTGYSYESGATYKLTAGFGREAGTLAPGAVMMLQNPGFTTFASTNITTANTTSNQFADVSTTYTANGTEGNIVIKFAIPAAIAGNAFLDIDNVRLSVVYPAKPAIMTPPASQTNSVGSTVSFNVVATGPATLSYQWQAGPVNGPFANLVSGGIVSGVKTNTLTLTGVTTNWALAYQVIVTNSYGAVTSTPPATLSVTLSTPISIPIPNWSFEAQSVTAGNYAIVNPTSWSVVGPSAGVVALINPASSDNRFTANPPPGLDGVNYCQVYSTGAGDNATVYQDTGVKYRAGVTYTLTAYFGREASAAPNSQLVLYNSSLVAIASNSISGAALTQNVFTSKSVTYTATGNEGGNGDIVVGFNTTGAASSTSFDFDNVSLVGDYPPGPVILYDPVSQSAYSGQNVSISVVAAGAGPLSYQWQATNVVTGGFTNVINGGQISGATSNVLTVANMSSNWALAYRVIVTNSLGTVTSAPASLTLLAGTLLPIANPNFDVDTITGGNAPAFQSGVTPTGWTAFGTNANGLVGLLSSANFASYTTPNGASAPNAFFSFTSDGSSNPGVRQILPATLNSNTTYTLSVKVGNRSSGTWGGYHIVLKTTNGTVLGDWVGVYNNVAAPGLFATSARSFTTGPNPPGLGQPLVIELSQAVPAAGSYSDFDTVSLIATPATPRAQGTPIDVYICSGQSNSHGWDADVAALSPANLHYANAPDARALFAYQCAVAGAASYSTGNVGQLSPEGAGHAGNFTGFGPELSAGSDLAVRFGRPLAVVKFASSGASLHTQFSKGANYLYPLLIAEVTNSLQQLTAQGYLPTLKGFFWLQGETDASQNPANYTNDIAQFVSDLRSDLLASNLQFVLTEINSNMPAFAPYQPGVAQVNGGMLALVNADPNVKYVTIRDITSGFADGQIHYTADQTVTIGQRWAAAFVAPPSTNAFLNGLQLNPAGSLTPAFASGTFFYTATNAYGTTPTVTVTNADATATNRLIYNGATNVLASGVASAPLALTLGGPNVVTVQVTAPDGVTKQVYMVNVTELPSQTKPVLASSVSPGTVTLSWAGDHLGYRLLTQTNNLNLGLSSNPIDWGTLPGSVATNLFIFVTTNLVGFYRLVYP